MIARKSALIILIQVLNGILGYIGLKFIASYMQPWEYGVVGFAYGFVALFSIFGNLGFGSAHVKKVSEGKNLATCIGTFVITKIFLTGLLASAAILSIVVWKFVIGMGFESPLHETAIYVMLAYFVLFTLTQSMISTFNAKKEIAKAQIPLFFYNLIRIGATIFVAFYGLGILALAYTYLLGEIFHFILALFFFKKYPVGKPSLECLKDYTTFAMPMSIAVVSLIIMRNIDKVFIQLFWSAQQVGEYFAMFNLSRFVILFSSAVGMLLFPTISEYHAKNNMKKIKRLVITSERYMSMIVFPIVIMIVVLSEPIIRILLSDKYLDALLVLQILPFFVLIEALSIPYQNQLQGMNMPKILRNRVVLMVVINVILNLALIPKDIKSIGINLAGLGATGAAIATVVSYVIGLVYSRLMAWKLTGITGNARVLIHAMAATLTGIMLHFLNNIFFIARWYHLLGFTLMGLGIYLAILYIFKEFTKEDFYFFIDTLNIKKMWKYIVKEIKREN